MGERHDQYWAEYFGMTVDDLRAPGISIIRHVGLGDYRGVWFFLRGSRLVVSAPDPWLSHVRGWFARTRSAPRLPTYPEIAELFGTSVERTIGPTFQGALEAGSFCPVSSAPTRILRDTDSQALSDFRSAASADDLSASALDKAELFRSGYFENGRIVALAGFRPLNATVGDACVLTLAEHRGGGYGRAVVSSVLSEALARDHVPLYQTLESNVAAVRIALALGYTRYSNRLAVRLTNAAPLGFGG